MVATLNRPREDHFLQPGCPLRNEAERKCQLRALEFDPKELEYTPAEKVKDDETDEMIEISPAVYDAGIQKILASWDDMVGRSQTDRKGELREKYYLQLRRGGSESVPNFALRYRTLIGEMKAEGITVDPSEQAWFFKQKLALSELQRQMLETTLGVETEDYGACEREAVRLFKRVHFGPGHGHGSQHREGGHGSFVKRPPSLTASTLSRFRKSFPSTTSSSTPSWRRGGKGFGGSINVTEYDDEVTAENEAFEAEGEPPAEEDDGGATDAESLAGLEGLQQTIEALATEIDELAEGSQADDDLAAIEEQVEGAVEALVTLREARSQINALKRDRGFRGPGSTGFKGGKGRGKKGSGSSQKDGKCFACGQTGHWQGDAECPAAGKSIGKGTMPKFPRPMQKPGTSSSTTSPKSSNYRSEAHTVLR